MTQLIDSAENWFILITCGIGFLVEVVSLVLLLTSVARWLLRRFCYAPRDSQANKFMRKVPNA